MSTDGDFTDAILYRMAYGLAADLAEIRRYDHAWGRAFAAGAGDDRRAIEDEVRARLDAAQGAAAELVARVPHGRQGGPHAIRSWRAGS